MNKLKPRAPVRPQGRFRGLQGASSASYRSPSPAMLRSPSPVVTVSAPAARRGPAPCEQCGSTKFTEDNGQVICENCGTISLDTGNFSNDVVFGETDSGRTQQVGTRVNEGQTHQRTFMPRNQPLGRVGHEAMQTSEKAKLEADSTFNKFAMLLGVRQKEKNAAGIIFQMAYGNGFVRGRTIESVAIVCLYLATRRAKDANPPYSLMLIDFAEPANINVFDLGRMMQDMVKRLYLGSDGKYNENDSLLLRAPGAEVLIEKFVKHLDFGADEVKIRKDATKILQRMKKDWLHDGRRPSGVCGAAVILAARMNNYRRTLREVVLCAKVTEITVNKRLEEFKETDSSKLSVNDFRNDDLREALKESDPPAFSRLTQPTAKRKRGRTKKGASAVTAAELENDQSETGEPSEPVQKRARMDSDGFAVPEVPASASQPSEQPAKRGPGKPKGSKNWKAPPPTAAEIAYEAEMEHDIQEALDQNQDLDNSRRTRSSRNETEQEYAPSDVTINHQEHDSVPDQPGPSVSSNEGNIGNVNMDPEIGDTEFDDDPEVSTCILSEAEKALKERIWVTENAEWLRQENAKKVKKELKIRHLIEQGIDPEELQRQKGKVIKRKDGARRSGRVGDVEYLKDDFHRRKKSIGEGGQEAVEDGGKGEDGVSTGPDATQAQVAVRKMFNQRGTFSRRINYKNLLDAYQLPSENPSLSPSRSPSKDREDSVVSAASDGTPKRGTRSGIEWFHGNKQGQTRSRGSIAQEKRQARERAERQRRLQDATRDRGSRSGSGSGSPAQEEDEDEEENIVEVSKTNQQSQLQLPTPNPTQSQSKSRQQQPKITKDHDPTAKNNNNNNDDDDDRIPSEEPVSDTDSPLSSTYTPQGTRPHSGTSTPHHTNLQQQQQQQKPNQQIQPQRQELNEDDVSSDEGDYVEDEDEDNDEDDDDDDDDDDDGDEGLDAAFAGRYQRGIGSDGNGQGGGGGGEGGGYEWNDEIVED